MKTYLPRIALLARCLPLVALCSLGLSACRDGVDTIVAGDYVVTMDESLGVIEDGAVVVDNGEIVAVGPAKDIYRDYQSTHVIPGDGRVVMPGLINGHTHTAMTLFRGIADDTELMTWLQNTIFPLEAEFVTPEFIAVGAELACYEMISSGTTTFVDMYFYPEVIAQVVDSCGLRAILAAPMIDYPSPGFEGWQDSHAAGVAFVRQWQGKNDRITPALAPHAPYTVAPQHLQEVGDSARELKAPISIHLAETYTELEQISEQEGIPPIAHALNRLGNVRVIGAHAVFAQPDEFPLMASAQFGAIHNPTSNAKLASGIAPVTDMLAAGVAVGLGTDGAASNNDLNMFEEIKLAALIHKLRDNSPTALPAATALSLATRSGAKAIGLEDRIGQLAPGMAADLIQLSINETRSLPVHDIESHLVYTADARDLINSMVAGKLVFHNGEVLTIDEKQLRRRVAQVTESIQQALED
ncbi:amidohydrolase family protein [Halioxenophilus aromaticivorans]|uniref:5-methylthioadenosine/S-adenosylhomocysteine deaminase n=1 Tax=Halioxenophilus aromaticivorans TaxID=1306992 RepID=A0AAV3U6K1_9ALTE